MILCRLGFKVERNISGPSVDSEGTLRDCVSSIYFIGPANKDLKPKRRISLTDVRLETHVKKFDLFIQLFDFSTSVI